MHRIFIAINLPEKVKEKLIFHQNKIEELFIQNLTEGSGAGPIRWTKKESLHITLNFLGNVSDEELMDVLKITKEVGERNQPFLINLIRICYGPPKQPPKMVWVEGEKSEELGKLQNDLESSLAGRKILERENRAYSPHITLGRIKQWEFRKIETEERPQVNEEISYSFEVKSIELMESQLKRGGSEYTVLESAPLGAGV